MSTQSDVPSTEVKLVYVPITFSDPVSLQFLNSSTVNLSVLKELRRNLKLPVLLVFFCIFRSVFKDTSDRKKSCSTSYLILMFCSHFLLVLLSARSPKMLFVFVSLSAQPNQPFMTRQQNKTLSNTRRFSEK